MNIFYTFGLVWFGFGGACAQKVVKQSNYQPLLKDADFVARRTFEPTRSQGDPIPYLPDGELSIEEIARRKARNEVQPIVFGLGAGGISMATTYRQSQDILATPIDFLDHFLYYPERIAVDWAGASTQTPLSLKILEGYPGIWALKTPLGPISLRMGDKLSSLIGQSPTEEALRGYLRNLGSALEQGGEGYDCEQNKSCRLSYPNPATKHPIDLEFRRGFLRLSGDDGEARLLEMQFDRLRSLPKRLLEPIDYAKQSIGGLTLSQTKTELETRLGLPEAEDGVARYYDRGSFAVRKSDSPEVSQGIAALIGYQAPLDFGGTIGKRFLGQSFADLSPDADDGNQLMLSLDRALNLRVTADFDCRKEGVEKPCELVVVDGLWFITIDSSVFVFTQSPASKKIWLSIEIVRPN